MSIFEDETIDKIPLDDTIPLFCSFVNSRIVSGHTEYMIRVHRGVKEDEFWMLSKRYRDFCALHRAAQVQDFAISLPPKKIFGNLNRKFVMARQAALQKYMDDVLNSLPLSTCIHVKKFLDPDNYDYSFESALERASMALRIKREFHNLKSTPHVGWRIKKCYGKLKRYSESRREYVVSWIDEYGTDLCLNYKEMELAFKILRNLAHPYVLPIISSSCSPGGTMIIRPYCVKGSLRDIIYDKSPEDFFLKKLAYGKERLILPSEAVTTISVQVLHALAYLHEKGIPYGNLHSGNVFIQEDVAKISDLENGIFGSPSLYRKYYVENKRVRTLEDADVFAFGHVLYEMAFGESCPGCVCDNIPDDCYPYVKAVLRVILSGNGGKDAPMPSVGDLLRNDAFVTCSRNVAYKARPYCKITPRGKELLRRCKESVEKRMKSDQNELRKFKKLSDVRREIQAEEAIEFQNKLNNGKKRGNKVKCGVGGGVENGHCDKASTASSGNYTLLSLDDKDSESGINTEDKEKIASNVRNDNNNRNVNGSEAKETCKGDVVAVNDKEVVSKEMKKLLEKSPDSDRSAFLQSISNFDKTKLKKRTVK